MRLNYAIIFVSDMKRSVEFYRDVLGIPLKFESPGWTEFATEGVTLALHTSPGGRVEKHDPNRESAGHCRPGFCVTDLEGFHQRMQSSNVTCLQAPKMTFGVKIAQYADPDDLVISVSQAR